jgi:Tfp pilus assembly protein PilF
MKYTAFACALSLACCIPVYSNEPVPLADSGGCEVWGRIIGPSAVIASRVKIEMAGTNGSHRQSTTAVAGAFQFPAVPSGTYQFRVYSEAGQVILRQAHELKGNHDYVIVVFPIMQRLSSAVQLVSLTALKHKVPHKAADAINRGLKAAESGDIPKSIEYFEKAAGIDPYYTDAETNLAIQYSKLKDNSTALVHARKAYAMDPEYPAAWHTLAALLLTTGCYDESEVILRAAVKRHPESAELHGMLAMALLEQHMIDEGMVHLQRASTEFPQARLWAAKAFAGQGKTAEMMAQLREYMQSSASSCEKAEVQRWRSAQVESMRNKIAPAGPPPLTVHW